MLYTISKSELFKVAHKKARRTVKKVGNYGIAFSLALKKIYASEKSYAEIAAKTFGEVEAVIDEASTTATVKQCMYLTKLLYRAQISMTEIKKLVGEKLSKKSASALISQYA